MAHVFCLDASACALLSEDYPGTTRYHFQRELVACQTRACLTVLPGSSGATAADLRPQQQQQQCDQQLVLISSSNGKASVALHPSSEPAALQQALAEVQPAGEANLEAALKLALLVSRRFAPGSTRVTAFVASADAAATLALGDSRSGEHPAAAELRQRYEQAGVSLDVAVLCPREELGAAASTALEALTGSSGSSSGEAEPGGSAAASTTSGSSRLLWLSPVESAAESWQQLEPALEQLESSSSGSSEESSGDGASTVSGAPHRSALPARISRAPRQFDPLRHPRAPLLALRSGVQQPALCRGESLSRLGHLSADGMMRPWLPTYSSIAQQAVAAGAAAAAGNGGSGMSAPAGGGREGMVYVEVQPIPKYRTLLKVSAGRMLPSSQGAAPTAAAEGSPRGSEPAASPRSPGSTAGGYVAASSKLLRSLQALNVMDDEEEEAQASPTGQADGGAGQQAGCSSTSQQAAAAVAAPAVRYEPDGRRGTLRLLQAIKEPHLLKLVWSADREPTAGSSGSQQEQQALNMFASPADTSSSSGGAASRSSSLQSLLSFMPAAAVAASAARGPLVQEGCELWEAAAQHDWELDLLITGPGATAAALDSSSADSSSSSAAPARVEARQLPNGAQVLLVHADASAGSSSSSRRVLRRRQGQQPPRAAAFWLQQTVGAETLQPPAYATVPTAAGTGDAASEQQHQLSSPEEEELHQQAVAEEQDPCMQAVAEGQQADEGQDGQQHQQQQASEQGKQEGGAALLAAAVKRLLEQPPGVDLRRLRKDVKAGAIQVTPVTVGPLPATLMRDIVGARAAMMGNLGMENLDSWRDDENAANSRSTAGASSGSRSGSSATTAAASAAMREHKGAVLSLLRQRLSGQPAGRSGSDDGSSSGSGSEAREQQQDAPAGATVTGTDDTEVAAEAPMPAGAAGSVTTAIACMPPPHAQPSPAGSYADSNSNAGTPFGTPLHILPSPLLHHHHHHRQLQHGSISAGAAATGRADHDDSAGPHRSEHEADTAAVAADEDADHPGLVGTATSALPKREGSAVLVGAAGQGEPGSNDGPLFQLE